MPDRLSICGELFDPRGALGEQCLVAEAGIIKELREEPLRDSRVLDYRGTGAKIVPGFVDIHVHLRGLGLSYKEDEYTGTLAAASAGIVLVADMPNTVPRLESAEAVAAKLEALKTKSLVDYRVYAAVPRNMDELEKIARLPRVAGFKIYPSDLRDRAAIVERLLGMNHLVVVHPELPEAEKPVTGSEDARRALRSCHWEIAAVEYLEALSPQARIHITHASCPGTIATAKRHGFSVDTTPSYLFLEPSSDCLHRVNPPLRGLVEKQRILQLLLEGLVDAVASDHAPHTPREKTGDPLLCPPGIPWLEHWPQALYCLVKRRAMKLEEYLRVVSLGPAEIIGEKQLGLLEPGYYLSIAIITETHDKAMFNYYSRARLAPYSSTGLSKCMKVKTTIVKGRVVYSSLRNNSVDRS